MSNLGALDMALDDVISQNRTNNKRSNSNNNNSRRGQSGGINKNRSSGGRSSPYNGARPSRNNNNNNNNNNNTLRNNNRIPDNRGGNARTSNNSLVVANLHFNVTEKDLYDLFGQMGKLKRAFLHIGPNGKSAGIADIVFFDGRDADKARNTYNNVELDGRPMHINKASIISAVQSSPINNRRGPLRGGNNDRRGNNNNNNSNSRGGHRGNKRESRPKPSQEDLDAEMDSYMGANNEDTQMN